MSSSAQKPTTNPETIRQFKLFDGLTDPELETVAQVMKQRTFETGFALLEHDTLTTEVYFLLSGRVSIEIPMIGRKEGVPLATLGPGDSVGEFALVRSGRRSATASAISQVVTLEAESQDLISTFDKHPRIGYVVFGNLSRVLSDRLVATNMFTRTALSQTF